MHRIFLASPFFLLILILFYGCGSSVFVNTRFTKNLNPSARIALVPALHDKNPTLVDSVFQAIFRDSTSTERMENPATVRSAFSMDLRLRDLITKISGLSANPSDDKASSLAAQLSAEEYSYLKRTFSKYHLLLVPARFSLTDAEGAVLGKATFRVYEVDSGELLLEDKASFNVMPGGGVRSGGLLSAIAVGPDSDPKESAEARYCIGLLAAHAKSSLKKNVIDRLR